MHYASVCSLYIQSLFMHSFYLFYLFLVSVGLILLPCSSLLRRKLISSKTPIRFDSKLHLDLFGLGPTEIIVIGAAGLLLFGPDKFKGQLREKGIKSELVSEGWRADSFERIKDMRKYAKESRKRRSWQRINKAIEDGDEEILKRIEEIEEEEAFQKEVGMSS